MKIDTFPSTIRFCYEWRQYQQRILHELEDHLDDGRMHIIAPPGSGKTVLGLELMLRLDQPTLILAPTLAIKHQWENRFLQLFLQSDKRPDWISMDIKQPAFVTITTYQSLYSLHKAAQENPTNQSEQIEEAEGIIEEVLPNEAKSMLSKLKRFGFKTCIVDEAHHLRSAWWHATKSFQQSLKNSTTIALTATPPYDAAPVEWERYIALCGPIDVEIHVAELVKAGDLCPHQDYVHFSTPQKSARKQLAIYHEQVNRLYEQLPTHPLIVQVVSTHPWMVDPLKYTEDILNEPAIFSSMLIYAKAAWLPIHEDALKLLGDARAVISDFSLEWAELLLNGLLEHKDIFRLVKKFGVYEKGKVYLHTPPHFDRLLMQSSAKLDSIKEIIAYEQGLAKKNVQMVILADYIYKEALNQSAAEQNQLGVLPIFVTLKETFANRHRLAVLTGSIVIVPAMLEATVLRLAEEKQFVVQMRLLEHDDNYLVIESSERAKIVALVTELFENGHIHILIGTAALLGEGWDAPSIHVLILASYVGTSMLSNQIRGRAIRSSMDDPNKTGVIWHLATIDDAELYAGHDYEKLERRFGTLVGLHTEQAQIETGFARLGRSVQLPITAKSVTKRNKQTFQLAKKRDRLKEQWLQATSNVKGKVVEELRMPQSIVKVSPFVFHQTIRALYYAALSIVTVYIPRITKVSNYIDEPYATYIVYTGVGVCLFFAGKKFLKAGFLALKYRSPENHLTDIGLVLYDTLFEMKLVETPIADVEIEIFDNEGVLHCTLHHATPTEQRLFMEQLAQLLEPIENPKYMIYEKSAGFFGLGKQFNYYAVPDEIGRKKDDANIFIQHWTDRFRYGKLIYTRSVEGRAHLLRARLQAMSAMFIKRSERVSMWK